MTAKLLTADERKKIIERLVAEDEKAYTFTKKELKHVRKLYNQWSDATLLSVRFK